MKKLYLFLCLSIVLVLNCSADTICILYSANNKFTDFVAKSVRAELEELGFNIIDCSYSGNDEYKALGRKVSSIQPDYLLSLGKSSTRVAASLNINGVFAMAMNTYSLGLYDDERVPLKRMTGILLNVNPAEQIDILARTINFNKGLGIVYNPENSQFLINDYKRICDTKEISFKPVICTDSKNIIDHYIKNKNNVDCFLSMLDSSLYSMKDIMLILQFVTKNKLPFVGFSTGMVKKGALLSTFADGKQTPEQIVKIFKLLKDGVSVKDIKIQYPEKFGVSINVKLEKSYNVKFDKKTIIEAVEVIK